MPNRSTEVTDQVSLKRCLHYKYYNKKKTLLRKMTIDLNKVFFVFFNHLDATQFI